MEYIIKKSHHFTKLIKKLEKKNEERRDSKR